MVALPVDLERWIAAHFAAAELNAARRRARGCYGVPPWARGAIWCEYDVVDGKLTHVRNLSEPLN